MSSYILEYNMDRPFAKTTSKKTKALKNQTGTTKKYNTNKLLAFHSKKELKTSFSSQKETSDILDIESDSESSVNCNYLGLYITDCNGTNSNRMHKFSTCNGPNKNSSSATLYYLYDCNSVGGKYQDEYIAPPVCSGCPENPSPESPSGTSTGGGNGGASDLNFPDPIPQYECIETDPITNECVNLVPYYPIIDMPVVEDEDEIFIFEEDEMFIDIESTPKIDDVKKELECFDKSNSAKLTIYVEQAVEKSREVNARLGHTFIGLEQNGIIRSLGFYPDKGGAANLYSNQDSEIHDNSGSLYHVSITVDISASQLSNIITYTENYPEKYDLNNYNCSDFGIGVAASGGLSLPSTVGTYGIFFEGRNPGDLGEDMRELTLPSGATRDLVGGTAPNRSADCP